MILNLPIITSYISYISYLFHYFYIFLNALLTFSLKILPFFGEINFFSLVDVVINSAFTTTFKNLFTALTINSRMMLNRTADFNVLKCNMFFILSNHHELCLLQIFVNVLFPGKKSTFIFSFVFQLAEESSSCKICPLCLYLNILTTQAAYLEDKPLISLCIDFLSLEYKSQKML